MPIQCPTCSRVNPADAAYCYYDGRGLSEASLNGPLGLGTMSFPLPFSFSDGQGCANYNQLVLACDRRWSEARGYLVNGIWKSFFISIGRADLANLAVRSATQPDPDVGLCRLLEGLPADAEAMRPPKLALTATTEDLGALEPGKDYTIEVVIENQGMLMLSGSAMTYCDWLSFGDHQGNFSTKLFQTRDTYSLSVRVVGSKLRAGKTPLEGEIVFETNGGRQTVAVRATVPIRPFPQGPEGNDVLAGVTSPREIAVRAKRHPHRAAALFEQGAVKAWYESNGWTYPIRGTQAKGKCALQQFFEALGLTKPPHLEIDAEQINCQGRVGHRLMKKVIVRTAESKFVHAEAHSNQDWIKVLPAIPQGNSVTLPLRIEIPPRPGETLNASVTFLGNGQQRFIVPVTLTIDAKTDEQEEAESKRARWLQWSVAGGVVFLALIIAIGVVIHHRLAIQENPPPDNTVNVPQPQVPEEEPWWAGIPDTHLTASVAGLKGRAGEYRPIFEHIEAKAETGRREGYEQLAAKLTELARNPATREALGRFVAECCVYEPSEFNITPLLRGLVHQLPAEDSPFPPEDKGEEIERAGFWLRVVCDIITNKAVPLDRSRSLAGDLENIFGSALEPGLPAKAFPERAEKALAEQFYHNLLPTAEKSIKQALTIRQVLLARFPQYIKPELRDQEDVKLLAIGLAKGNELWPKLEPIFKTCVDSKALPIGFKLIDLYEKANAELAAKMEVLLAARWKTAGNAKLTQAAKAAAIRKRMAAAKISPAERLQRLQELLVKSPLSAVKPGGQARTSPLQDSVRLAHASTMACILFGKDADVVRFDELIGRIPGSEQDKVPEEKKVENPQPPQEKEVLDLSAGNRVIQDKLTDENELDPRRQTYRKVYAVRLKAGQIYILDMRSSDLRPYLRVESIAGVRLLDDRGANARITFSPPADGVYHVIASSLDKKAKGNFTLQIARQQIIRFGAPQVPPPVVSTTGEQKAPPLNLSDLADLGHKQSNVRIAAFTNVARSLPANLPYRHAQKIANYLLLTESEAPAAELEAVTSQLGSLAKCRNLLEALADVIANGDKLAPRRAETIVGGLLNQKLRFERDEDWRLACRKLLLQRALELTGHSNNAGDKDADFLRDLYKEQGLAFGLEAPDFQEQTQLTPVLERLIKHVAAANAQQMQPPAEKTYLEQISHHLQAARYLADNDLQYMVLLQRIWIKVLVLALQGRLPPETQKRMAAIPRDLDIQDRDASNLLAQLRSGEENILRVWALAHDLKLP